MALVRVYCGLASADPADRPASAGSTLTSAVVDDAGRLLHVCEISDDPAGYAQLVALLVERSGGPSGAAIAADSDDHTVTSLLSAAGRPLAIADDDSVDDFAERFADDDSLEEMQSPPAERRAVGLARALQAGALSAVTLPAPRDLAGYKQVLAAHAALASGRHSAAVALREVLRELYPAALRAYPDPAEPVSLAVLDALPEPGMLGGTVGPAAASVGRRGRRRRAPRRGRGRRRRRDQRRRSPRCGSPSARRPAAPGQPGAHLRRGRDRPAGRRLRPGLRRRLRGAGRRAQRPGQHAVAGARPPGRCPPRRAVGEPTGLAGTSAGAAAGTDAGCRRRPDPAPAARGPSRHPPSGRRSRPEPVPRHTRRRPPRPLGPPPVAPAPVTPPPVAPAPVTPAASPVRRSSALPSRSRAAAPAGSTARPTGRSPRRRLRRRASPRSPRRSAASVPPAEAGEPFRPTLTTAAINNARAERQRTVDPAPPQDHGEPASHARSTAPPAGSAPPTSAFRCRPRGPAQESAPPGSRANWPLVNNPEDPTDSSPTTRSPTRTATGRGVDAPTDPAGRRPGHPALAGDDLPPGATDAAAGGAAAAGRPGAARGPQPSATSTWRRRRCAWSTASRPLATVGRPPAPSAPSTGRRPRPAPATADEHHRRRSPTRATATC